MLRAKYHDLFNSDELRRLAPGFYVDLLGGGYFYLTEMYASISIYLLEKPHLNTPAFVAEVLEELRKSLEAVYWIECASRKNTRVCLVGVSPTKVKVRAL